MRSAKSKFSGGILIIFLVFSLIATFSIATADSTEDGWNSDSDGDGMWDAEDNCPNSHGGDNSINGCPDDDGDGVPNHEDAFPNDPNEDADQDNDGIGDNAEGRGSGAEDHRDSDDDGTADYRDDDSDNDGIRDFIEGDEDEDDDGTPNYLDSDSDNDGIPDSVEGDEDADSDGIPNFLDTDSDGDGYDDETEDGHDSIDADGDGIPDYLDTDSDNDGLSDADEKDKGTERTEEDSDMDGLTDGDEVNIYGTNPIIQDTDGDGLTDGEEINGMSSGSEMYTSNPLSKDSDGDGLEDNEEIQGFKSFEDVEYSDFWYIYTDPSSADTDEDGLTDYEEISIANYHITNPIIPDTDGDGIKDGLDNCPGEINADQKDLDGDGIGTECDPIELVFKIHPKDDDTITEGPYLFNEEITFSAEESYSFGQKLSEGGIATITWIFPDGTLSDFDGTADATAGTEKDLTFENSGIYKSKIEGSCVPMTTAGDGSLPSPPSYAFYRNKVDCTVTEEIEFEVEITNGLYAVISKPTAGITIQPNQQLLFEEDSYSTGEPIDSWIIDFGDESQPYGYLSFDQQYTCYSSTVATQFCSTNILTVGGNFEDGAICGCGDYTTEIFPTTVVDITNFAGRKTGHTYESLESCGDDFICTVTLTVGADSDDDGTIDFTSSTTLDLPFSEISVCSEFPTAAICTTGELNLDNLCERAPELETCQDDTNIPPNNLTGGNFTNETKKLDTLDPKITGQESHVSKNTANKKQYSDPLDNVKNAQGTGTGGKDKGSSGAGTILVIIILLSAIGGLGFYFWKKGMFDGSKSKPPSTDTFEATPETTKSEPEPAKEEKPDSSSEIQAYIDKAKVAGESNDQMKEGLKAAGWPDSEINKYL